MITGTVPVEVPKKLSDLVLDAGGKRIDNLGLGDTLDDVMRRSEKTEDYGVYGLVQTGLAADRPAPGIVDRFYFSIDTLVLERDTGAAWVEVARGEAATRLAQLAERAHSSLTGIGVGDHHARYTDAEAQAQAAALIVIHTAIAAAHHAKTTDAAEIVSGTFILARIPVMDWAHISGLFPRTIAALLSDHNLAHHALGVIVPHDALASLTEKSHASLTNITPDQHHTRSHDHSNVLDGSPIAEAGVPAHMSKSKLAFTVNKLLKGAGPGADPTEIDVPTGITKLSELTIDADKNWAGKSITNANSITANELHGTTYWGDVYLEDTECPVCHRKFKMGDRLVFAVNKVEEKFITAVPIHQVCDGG